MPFTIGKLLHPDFAQTGVKPSGPVQLDWSHKIARGLEVGYIFNNPLGIVVPDITGKHTGANVGVVGSIGGAKLASFDGSSFITIESAGIDFSGWQGLTIFAKMRLPTGNEQAIISQHTTTDAERVFEMSVGTDNKWHFACNNFVFNIKQTNTAVRDTMETVSASWEPSIFAKIYRNGVLEGTDSTSIPSALFGTTVETRLGSYSDGLQFFLGDIECLYLFSRSLDEREHALLNINPYQFLQPLTQYIPYTIPAVGGVVSVDSWYTIKENPVLTKNEVISY